MEVIMIKYILESLGDGNYLKGGFMIAVFVVIWIEVRSLKKKVGHIGETIDVGFKTGNDRFSKIETRITLVEEKLNIGEFSHGSS